MKKHVKLICISLILISAVISFLIGTLKEKNEERLLVQKINSNEDYFAIIEIPKISLKRELFNIYDKRNNVDKNILVHENSNFPKKIILASHSGPGEHAYFNNLYKLKEKDIIKIYYQNKVYEYVIKEIEEQNKTGELYIKDTYSDELILITCTKNNNKTQSIYYSNLKRITDI